MTFKKFIIHLAFFGAGFSVAFALMALLADTFGVAKPTEYNIFFGVVNSITIACLFFLLSKLSQKKTFLAFGVGLSLGLIIPVLGFSGVEQRLSEQQGLILEWVSLAWVFFILGTVLLIGTVLHLRTLQKLKN